MKKTQGNAIDDVFTVRATIAHNSDGLQRIINTIQHYGTHANNISIINEEKESHYSITLAMRDDEDAEALQKDLQALGIKDCMLLNSVENVHYHGKLSVLCSNRISSRQDLAKVYTPKVGDICLAIAKDSQRAYDYTIKANTIGVITDGTAVLGFGDIGVYAALPVMEGKAMLFKKFAGLNAFPIAINTKSVDEIVNIIKNIEPVFGGINLEDIAAPRCFEIEERLEKELDIPVFHDDQHGTAIVCMAGLRNALKLVKKDIKTVKIIVIGAGAAGTSIVKMMVAAGAANVFVFNKSGMISKTKDYGTDKYLTWIAENTNANAIESHIDEAIVDADVFIGVSVAGALSVENVKKMNKDAIVFAMANPVPEIMPEEAIPYVRIMATGRSDYPNQINNVLAFPGVFKGALAVRASRINEEMKQAASIAISESIADEDLTEENIMPDIFTKGLADKVAEAVKNAAIKTGVAKKKS